IGGATTAFGGSTSSGNRSGASARRKIPARWTRQAAATPAPRRRAAVPGLGRETISAEKRGGAPIVISGGRDARACLVAGVLTMGRPGRAGHGRPVQGSPGPNHTGSSGPTRRAMTKLYRGTLEAQTSRSPALRCRPRRDRRLLLRRNACDAGLKVQARALDGRPEGPKLDHFEGRIFVRGRAPPRGSASGDQ